MQCIYDEIPSEIRRANRSYHGLMLRGLSVGLGDAALKDSARAVDAMFDSMKPNNLETLVDAASPSLWFSTRQIYVSLGNERHSELSFAVEHFMAAAFDSFWQLLEPGSIMQVDASKSGMISLPRIGVRLRTRTARLGRIDDQPAIDEDGVLIPIHMSRHAEPILASHVAFSNALVVGEAEPTLFDDFSVDAMRNHGIQTEIFAAQLEKAFDLLQQVSPRLASALRDGVRWYVPLRAVDKWTHRSHSSLFMPGVIFLSPSDRPVELAEAMVHEFGHNELNSVENVSPLVEGSDTPVYYSPWRSDNRPLRGLIHALFVFCGVSAFLKDVEEHTTSDSTRQIIHQRRNLVMFRLRLGMKQIPWDRLSDTGQRLLQLIASAVKVYEIGLEGESSRIPDEIREHWQIWRAKNPGLVGYGPG